MAQDNEKEYTHIRVSKSTHRLLTSMQKRDKDTNRVSADAAIKWMWGRLSKQAQEIKKWKSVSGFDSAADLEDAKGK